VRSSGADARAGARWFLNSSALTKAAFCSALKQLVEFFYGQSGLPNDGAKRARFKVARGMARHRDYSRRITRMRKNVVAADDAIDDKCRSRQRPHDALAADRGQSRRSHARRRR
jgi:hypothetical protein